MPEYASISTTDLQTFERNPRRGNIDAIADSLTKHGQYQFLRLLSRPAMVSIRR